MLTGYKGFNSKLQCTPAGGKPFQYEVGKTYKTRKVVSVCEWGFHFCKRAIDVLDYYGIFGSRFGEVETTDTAKTDESTDKISSSDLKVVKELTIQEFISKCVQGLSDDLKAAISGLKKSKGGKSKLVISRLEYGSRATAKDDVSFELKVDSARVASSGYNTRILTSKYGAVVATSGCGSEAVVDGADSEVATAGRKSKTVVTGVNASIACAGHASKLLSTGRDTAMASSGAGTQMASSGNDARIASSGYSPSIVVTGPNAMVACSGSSAQVQAHGPRSVVAACDGCSTVECLGEASIAAAFGSNSTAKASKGSWIVLAEYKADGTPASVVAVKIDGKKFLPNVPYELKNGKVVPA